LTPRERVSFRSHERAKWLGAVAHRKFRSEKEPGQEVFREGAIRPYRETKWDKLRRGAVGTALGSLIVGTIGTVYWYGTRTYDDEERRVEYASIQVQPQDESLLHLIKRWGRTHDSQWTVRHAENIREKLLQPGMSMDTLAIIETDGKVSYLSPTPQDPNAEKQLKPDSEVQIPLKVVVKPKSILAPTDHAS
jgi:hypothetical protein